MEKTNISNIQKFSDSSYIETGLYENTDDLGNTEILAVNKNIHMVCYIGAPHDWENYLSKHKHRSASVGVSEDLFLKTLSLALSDKKIEDL